MGGGLAFLTKKSFNPANWSNQRQVWEARQNQETENRRIAERDSQLKREREEEELARVVGGEEGGGRKALGFMYDAGKVPGLDRKNGNNNEDDEEYSFGNSNNHHKEGDGGDKKVVESSIFQRQPGDDDATAAFRAMLARGTTDNDDDKPTSNSAQNTMTAGEAALKDDNEDGGKNDNDDAKTFKPDHRTNLEKAVGRGINAGSGVTLAQQMERFPMLKGAPMVLQKSQGGGGSDDKKDDNNVQSLNFKPLGAVLRNIQCLKCGQWGHSRGDRECPVSGWNPFSMESTIPTAAPIPPPAASTAVAAATTSANQTANGNLSEGRSDTVQNSRRQTKKEKKRRRKEDRKHGKKKHKSHKRRKRSSRRSYSSGDSSTSSGDSDNERYSSRHRRRHDNDSDSSSGRHQRSKKESSRRHEKRRNKHERRRRSPSLSVSVTVLATVGALLLVTLSGSSNAFNYLRICNRRWQPSATLLFSGESKNKLATTTSENALALLNEAKALREEASKLQQQLNFEKEERIRQERDKVDSLIDSLLFHGMNDDKFGDEESNLKSKQQLLLTEEQVANLLISKRMNYEMVNQMFDRICELSNKPQSIDSCSPLLSLLLDAACKVDVIERKDNPNKRWNGRVERDLRRKLFALGYGIRIEDVESEKKRVRSITGEKDYS